MRTTARISLVLFLFAVCTTVASAEPVLVVGHRGLGPSGELPENTVPAFLRAVELGADAVETDVRLTADGVPVLLHDETLDRTTECSGPVASWTWAEVRNCRARTGFDESGAPIYVPSLDEAVEALAGRAVLFVEIKPVASERIDRVVDAVLPVCAGGVEDGSIRFTSFSPEVLAAIEARDPRWTTGLHRSGHSTRETIRMALRIGLDGVHARSESIDGAADALARDLGVYLTAGAVDRPADVARVAGFELDSVYTNRPDRIAEAVELALWDHRIDDDDDADDPRSGGEWDDDDAEELPDEVGCSDVP